MGRGVLGEGWLGINFRVRIKLGLGYRVRVWVGMGTRNLYCNGDRSILPAGNNGC